MRLTAAFLFLLLSAPATAQQVAGAQQVRFSSVFGWWMPAAQSGPAVIALHGCAGLYGRRGDLNERHRAMADLLGQRGFHVLFVDSFTRRGLKELCTTRMAERSLRAADRRFDVQGALDWLAARPEVDAKRIVLLGWSHGGAAVLASLVYARRNTPYQPAAPLLILIGALDDWTPAAPCIALKERAGNAVQLKVLPDAYHDFDHPSAPLRVRKDVPGGQRPGEGVTVGSNPAARRDAYEAMLDFLARQLAK